MITIIEPSQIQNKSFEIIQAELRKRNYIYDDDRLPVVTRVIHTTADFDYADNLTFSDNVVRTAVQAIKNGCDIVTDTNMAKAGINRAMLNKMGVNVHCYIADEDVAQEAEKRGVTRACVSMEKSADIDRPCIYAVGNAPTALIALKELIEARKINPVMIIGVPVGFVNVVESKEEIIGMDVPYIISRGQKGGSNVAAAICNALLLESING